MEWNIFNYLLQKLVRETTVLSENIVAHLNLISDFFYRIWLMIAKFDGDVGNSNQTEIKLLPYTFEQR